MRTSNHSHKRSNPVNPLGTAKELLDAKVGKDWLDEQEDAEVEALILHYSMQQSRSERLEAYNR